MLYFKHSELVNTYHVSLKTVHNWIDATKEGKLNLELCKANGRTYIANNPINIAALETLAAKGKKYRNTLYHKVANPVPEFYKLYSRKQILDIISNLTIHHEIPFQYNYFDEGAVNWDAFVRRRWSDHTSSLHTCTVELLRNNLGTLDQLLEDFSRINVIDIGPGNAFPVKELLGHLLERGKINRYIAIDISEEMLHIAKGNIDEWFGGRIRFEGHIRDITYERFDDLLVDNMLDQKADQTVNLALLLGATAMNFRSPDDTFKLVYSSLSHNDLLIYAQKPDSESGRRYFDFNSKSNASALSPIHRLIFDLLNINESFYDVEMGFNEEKRVRYIRIRLKVALTIEFNLGTGIRGVDFDKGETILLWRVWHMTALEVIDKFERVGFTLLQSSLTKDRQYLLTISGVNPRPEIDT